MSSSEQELAELKSKLQEAEATRKEEVSSSVKAVLAAYFASLSERLAKGGDEKLPPAAFLKIAKKLLKTTLKVQNGK